MFDNLTSRFSRVIKNVARRGAAHRSQHPGRAARGAHGAARGRRRAARWCRDFRRARARAARSARKWSGSLTPGQAAVGVVYRELVALMGETNDALNLADAAARRRPARRTAGLGQDHHRAASSRAGSSSSSKKKVLLASCDVYRPAAIEQLATLATQVEADFFPVGGRREAGRHRAARARPRAHALRTTC